VKAILRDLWSDIASDSEALDRYAEDIMVGETRGGIITLSVISCLLLSASALVWGLLEDKAGFVQTYVLLSLLALHISIAARGIRDIRVLHMLGMTLLTICGCAIVLLAHRTGSFGPALFGSAVLLFMLLPVVPWGLREAGTITLLIYTVFTASTSLRSEQFTRHDLLALQFLMVSAGTISLALVMRSATIRKRDIKIRFELENSHRHAELMSHQDPVTGAWNRRYLAKQFVPFSIANRDAGHNVYFAVLDVDRFKAINDSLGHTFGDALLQAICGALGAVARHDEMIIRMGGDEFAALFSGVDPAERIQRAMASVQAFAMAHGVLPDKMPTFSVGLMAMLPHNQVSLETAYRCADEAAYLAKSSGGNRVVRCAPRPSLGSDDQLPRLGQFLREPA
jgi:diguanylate cyclase